MIGKTYAHYEIIAEIGVGGMGAVYRARDTKLDRDVAIKVITPGVAGDPERVARFQREAKTLASLQHPNVAAIHGFEDIDGVHFLVMELVEGSDLSVQLQNGPLPEHEAVEIIRHVAAGLSEAHRNGFVHRDLKPANIMLTPDGAVKILDFGLARAATPDGDAASDPGLSPTLTAAMTQAGTILGTAAYMAPEQARGKTVDHRADIWALGTILYELLTGQRLFVGESTTDVLASVIKVAPELDELPSDTSPSVLRMLRRCLQRDPRRRLDSAADAILELDDEESAVAATEVVARRQVLPWVATLLFGAALVFTWLRPGPDSTPVFRQQYDLDLPGYTELPRTYAPIASPDGRWAAIVLQDSLRMMRVMLHSVETGAQTFVDNSDGARFLFWSPDSRFLGFFQGEKMSRLHLESGTVEVVTKEVLGSPRGASWSTDDKIIYAPGANTGLMVIDANGGPPTPVTTVDSTMIDGSHRWPVFLPDNRHFIYTNWSNVQEGRAGRGGIYLGSLDGDAPRQLLRDLSGAAISPLGQLLFQRGGQLMAVDFDFEAATVDGEPRVVAAEVGFNNANGQVAFSANDLGQIYYSEHNPRMNLQLGWIGRDGRPQGNVGVDLPLTLGLVLSPAGKYYAAEILDAEGSVQIWVGDIARESFARLSRFDSDCWGIIFSPDGREVLYGVQTENGNAVYRHSTSGARAAEKILDTYSYQESVAAGHWFAPDEALINQMDNMTGFQKIMLLDLQQKAIRPVLNGAFDQRDARLSPDGRWLAYVSTESGIPEVYIRNWPELDNKWQVSRRGGTLPHWNADGSELLYQSIRRLKVKAVDIAVKDDELQISLPRLVTPLTRGVRFITYTADHQKYLVGLSTADPELPPVRILNHWQVE